MPVVYLRRQGGAQGVVPFHIPEVLPQGPDPHGMALDPLLHVVDLLDEHADGVAGEDGAVDVEIVDGPLDLVEGVPEREGLGHTLTVITSVNF